MTIRGSTGSNSGDAFTITGRIQSVSISGVSDGYELHLDGRPVPARLVTDDSDDDGDEQILEILSTEENEFDYRVVVSGTAEKTHTEDVAADSSDRVIDNDDGTVTIRGSTGSNSGDAFAITGEILSIRISGVSDGYLVLLDGEDVTDEVQ